MKRILCYGDSNAWGHIPAKGTRYPDDVRWPGVAAGILGDEYRIIEDSISGRTTVFDDPHLAGRNGYDCLKYSLLAHLPIDLLIIALGSNDLKFTDAEGSRKGVLTLVDSVLDAEQLYDLNAPLFTGEKRILLVGPPYINDEIETRRPAHMLAHAAAESRKLSGQIRQAAAERGCWFIDLSPLVYPSCTDCLHLSPTAHRIVGEAMAEKILEILG